jgi:zinc transport system ATP-binding protein
LEHVQATHLVDRPLGQLSGGELQRVLLALALTPTPDLLLLDEPISGVDLAGMELFYQMVSELRRLYDLSILLVSHDLTSVGHVADRVVLLKNGTIQADGPPEPVLAGRLVRETFGYDFAAHTHSFRFKDAPRTDLAAGCAIGKAPGV